MRNDGFVARIASCLLLLLTAASAAAHHSRAAFDLDRVVEINGTVARWQFRNPHAFLHIDVEDAGGDTVRWVVEMGSIPNLRQIDMDRDTLKVGDKVVVQVNPSKQGGKPNGFFKSMTLADGRAFTFSDVFEYSRNARAAAAGLPGSPDFSGKWDEEISRRAVLLGSGLPDYPLTDEGRRVVERYDPAEEPWNFCKQVGLPSMIGTPYVIEIERDGDDYHFHYEMPGLERVVHMDLDEHPDDVERSVMGHSIGHMEGDTLVIDTVGFEATKWGIGEGLDSSEQKRVVERLNLTEDGHVLEIDYTVTDPVYLSGPYSRKHVKRLVSNYEITEYEECDEEAARMHLDLE